MLQKLPTLLGAALSGVRAGERKLLLNGKAAGAPETVLTGVYERGRAD